MSERRRTFEGVFIPASVWLDDRLGAVEKVIIGEIRGLGGDEGCRVKDGRIARFCHCDELRVVNALSNLRDLGYVSVESPDGGGRVLRCNLVAASLRPADESGGNDGSQPSDAKPGKATRTEASVDAVIDHLNEVTGKSFKKGTKTTRSKIKTLLKSGYEVDDIKAVIDLKTSQWLHDPRMSAYLRPKTLFAQENFEGYIEESKGGSDGHRPAGGNAYDYSRYYDESAVMDPSATEW